MSVGIPLPLEDKCITRAGNSVLNFIIQKICKQIRGSRREREEQERLNLRRKNDFFSKQKDGYNKNIAL